jgi:hypothetical protein
MPWATNRWLSSLLLASLRAFPSAGAASDLLRTRLCVLALYLATRPQRVTGG